MNNSDTVTDQTSLLTIARLAQAAIGQSDGDHLEDKPSTPSVAVANSMPV